MRIRNKRKLKFLALFLSLSLITLASAELLSRQLAWNLESSEPDYTITFGEAPPVNMIVGVGGLDFSLVYTNVGSSPDLRRGTLLIHVDCLNPESVSIETPPTVGAGTDPRYQAGIWFFDASGDLTLVWWILPNVASSEVNYILYIDEVDSYSFSFQMDDVVIT